MLLCSISSFGKLEIFQPFCGSSEWRVLKTNKIMRRRGSGRVPFRALCLRKFTLKARPRLSGRVLAESIALFRNTFETRHSPYYIRYHTFYVKSNDFYTAIFRRFLHGAFLVRRGGFIRRRIGSFQRHFRSVYALQTVQFSKKATNCCAYFFTAFHPSGDHRRRT